MFKELKKKYSGEIITLEQMEEIEETEGLTVESNGNSGRLDAQWFTVYKDDRTDEFDCYINYR